MALAACVAGAAGPFACGGNAFTAAGGDGGPTIEGSVEGAADAPVEGAEGAPGDGSAMGDQAPPAEAGVPVHGTVVDQFLMPMAGVQVHSQTHAATTAPDGTFTLPSITIPYITTVVTTAAGGHKHGYVFSGVNRRDVTLQLAGEQAGVAQSTALSGHLAASGAAASGIVFADLPAATPAAASNTIPITLGASDYSGAISWTGSSGAAATLYALQWLTTNGAPNGYIAYGSAPESLMSGTGLIWPTPTSPGPGQGTMTVSLGVSMGYVAGEISVFFRPPTARIAAAITHDFKVLTNSDTVVTPDITGSTFVACGVQVPPGSDAGTNAVFGAACKMGLGKDDAPSLALPPPPTFVSPPTTAGIGTTFTWNSLPSAVYLVVFAPAGGTTSAGDTVFVLTTDSQQKVPDLSLLGFVVPSGTTYVAEVYALAPFPTMDSALGPGGFAEYLTDFALDQGPTVDGQLARSDFAPFAVP